MNEQKNGNNQLNTERENFNDRVEKKALLGKTKRIAWFKKRRNRTI